MTQPWVCWFCGCPVDYMKWICWSCLDHEDITYGLRKWNEFNWDYPFQVGNDPTAYKGLWVGHPIYRAVIAWHDLMEWEKM